jgi:hypothetical protein
VAQELDEAGTDSSRSRLDDYLEGNVREMPDCAAGVLQDLLVPTGSEKPCQCRCGKAGRLRIWRGISAPAKVQKCEGAGPEHGTIDAIAGTFSAPVVTVHLQ